MVCCQRYIKSIGPKAFISRVCWRKNKTPYAWVISSKYQYYSEDSNKVPETQRFATNLHVMGACSIVQASKGRYVDETVPYIVNIVKYVERNISGAHFEEFIADFMKDEADNWWLINIKAFQLVDHINIQISPFFESDHEDNEEEDAHVSNSVTKFSLLIIKATFD